VALIEHHPVDYYFVFNLPSGFKRIVHSAKLPVFSLKPVFASHALAAPKKSGWIVRGFDRV
jgi:hypothetical protein